ncbi:MAG: ABC transporter permease, partial [Thermoanaerobaculia bacterium]
MKQPRGRAFGERLRSAPHEALVLALCIVYSLALIGPTRGLIATPANLANLLSDMLPLLVVAVGQTIVLVAGGIDLSV